MKLKQFLKDFFSKKMLIIFFLGFSSGLPLLLTGGTLKTWLAREGVDISTIGYFSWVGLSYSLKFIWAPLLDRFTLFPIGRRRSWMIGTQICLMLAIASLGFFDPKFSIEMMAGIAVLIAFFSATQDIAIDAFRREYLKEEELGMGSTLNQYGYRIAMLLSGGIGIGMVGSSFLNLTWNQLYFVMAGFMSVGILFTLWAPEAPVSGNDQPKTLKSAVIDPFKEFLTRDKALVILSFVFLFKLGDALSGAMLNPFYVQMGYSNEDIGLIAKMFGLTASLVGLFVGSVIIYSMGILRSLWIFGILQALSTAMFALITYTGPVKWALAVSVIFEDVSSGMGSAAFVAYLAALTNKKYTATQYAILSSLATVGRNFFSGFSGNMVKALGWETFFYTCGMIAIPGLIMLFVVSRAARGGESEAQKMMQGQRA
jgi:PAT family beta-lactamase induction signal transducer AmpG